MTGLEAESAVDKFDAPLNTQAAASRFLGRSESTFRNCSRGYHSVVQGREVIGKPVSPPLGRWANEVRRSRSSGSPKVMHSPRSAGPAFPCSAFAQRWSGSTLKWALSTPLPPRSSSWTVPRFLSTTPARPGGRS